MKLNTPSDTRPRTHEGAPAKRISATKELRRLVLTALLWEDTFYESGSEQVQRMRELVADIAQHDPELETVANLAMEARSAHNLRHVPLLLARELARFASVHTDTVLEFIIQRPDELPEFLRLYWDGAPSGPPLANKVKKGLAAAFRKFDEYSLAKWNTADPMKPGVNGATVSLRDVLRLVHPRPKDPNQADLWRRLAQGPLPAPDTWETRLSSGEDKREAFTSLLQENRLGYMATLRNLRNMRDAGVSEDLVDERLVNKAGQSRVLPFRFFAAARAVPEWEPMIDAAMLRCLQNLDRLPGRTLLLVDVSYSMNGPLSARSDLSRKDAAAALAVLLRGVADDCEIVAFGENYASVPPRQGMALGDAIAHANVDGGGTMLGRAVNGVLHADWDRLVVLTDEQSHDHVPEPWGASPAYLINVANYRHGVGYGRWVHIDGFSEAVLSFIRAYEAEEEGWG